MSDLKLTIEVVPETSWYDNVRAILTKEQWNILKRQVYSAAWDTCQICGGIGPKWPVEAHEIWSYDDEKHIQKLEGMIALCPPCHQVKHIGLAQVNGKLNESIAHLMEVNKMSKKDALAYIKKQFEIWKERSKNRWTLDLSKLEDYGIKIESK